MALQPDMGEGQSREDRMRLGGLSFSFLFFLSLASGPLEHLGKCGERLPTMGRRIRRECALIRLAAWHAAGREAAQHCPAASFRALLCWAGRVSGLGSSLGRPSDGVSRQARPVPCRSFCPACPLPSIMDDTGRVLASPRRCSRMSGRPQAAKKPSMRRALSFPMGGQASGTVLGRAHGHVCSRACMPYCLKRCLEREARWEGGDWEGASLLP